MDYNYSTWLMKRQGRGSGEVAPIRCLLLGKGINLGILETIDGKYPRLSRVGRQFGNCAEATPEVERLINQKQMSCSIDIVQET